MFAIWVSVIFFLAAAVIGTNPLWSLIKKIPAKLKFVFIHGGLALTGLTLLIIGTTDTKSDVPILALITLVLTAMGGLMLFALRRAKAPVPPGMAMLHPIFAIGGLILLFVFLFGNN